MHGNRISNPNEEYAQSKLSYSNLGLKGLNTHNRK